MLHWKQSPHFPDYEVSDAGDVRRLTPGGRRYRAGHVLEHGVSLAQISRIVNGGQWCEAA